MDMKKENIVLFPFMAQGHIIPFLTLALKLEQEKSCQIFFINTPLNIKKLQSSLPPSSTIRLLEIHFNSSDHGLPPATESTENLPPLLLLRLLESSPSLKPAFRELISTLVNDGQKPLCVISDMFFGWSAEVAHEFGVFHAIFNAGGGYGMAAYHSTWINLPHTKANDSGEISLPGFSDNHRFHVTNLAEELRMLSEPWIFGQNMFKDWGCTDGMLLNTVEEFDRIGLTYFRNQFSCPIWPIGPVLPFVGTGNKSSSRDKEGVSSMSINCMEWLDTKAKGSVLYVAFGSQHVPSASQAVQLATALEGSGKSFIWVVNKSRITYEEEGETWFPKGFEERIQESDQGLIVKEWAPQKEILSHESIGAFLTHCGWNSVLEALSNGVPLISWSIAGDQPYNAKMLEEEIGVSVGLANGTQCKVTSEEIMEKIELVMSETEKGKEMKRKAFEVKEMIGNAWKKLEGFKGSSAKALDEFLEAAILMRTKLDRDCGKSFMRQWMGCFWMRNLC